MNYPQNSSRLLGKIVPITTFLLSITLLFSQNASAAEAGSGPIYSVIELAFSGPSFTASQTPARDVDFYVDFQHSSGSPTYRKPEDFHQP